MLADGATALVQAESDPALAVQQPAPAWFSEWAASQGIQQFAHLLEQAGLISFVESCGTPLTMFVPTNDAILAMRATLPTDMQLLRELLCVHITMGSLSREELLTTRSITTIGQQTHHVQVSEPQAEGMLHILQVGTVKLNSADIELPSQRGRVHVVDCVMCCLRLLQHCRFEQVWNKTVRPSPKVGLQGAWQPVDELHAVLVHCDTWTPRFNGLRGNVVPLGPVASTHGDRASRHFQDNVVHYSELLILEKPPEMSKKKRKKPEVRARRGAWPHGSPEVLLPPCTATSRSLHSRLLRAALSALGSPYINRRLPLLFASQEGGGVDDGYATPHYRMMFSLYRRDPPPLVPIAVAPGEEAPPEGKHLTFCMAPEDILIRNSFHMLSENEKEYVPPRPPKHAGAPRRPLARAVAARQSSWRLPDALPRRAPPTRSLVEQSHDPALRSSYSPDTLATYPPHRAARCLPPHRHAPPSPPQVSALRVQVKAERSEAEGPAARPRARPLHRLAHGLSAR